MQLNTLRLLTAGILLATGLSANAADLAARPRVSLDGTWEFRLDPISQEHNLLERHRARLATLGLLERYPEVRKISMASYFEYIRQAFERARLMPDLDGYHWWAISDIPSGFGCDVTDIGLLDLADQVTPDLLAFVANGIERGLPEAGHLLDCLVDYALSDKPASGDLPALTDEEARHLFKMP